MCAIVVILMSFIIENAYEVFVGISSVFLYQPSNHKVNRAKLQLKTTLLKCFFVWHRSSVRRKVF